MKFFNTSEEDRAFYRSLRAYGFSRDMARIAVYGWLTRALIEIDWWKSTDSHLGEELWQSRIETLTDLTNDKGCDIFVAIVSTSSPYVRRLAASGLGEN